MQLTLKGDLLFVTATLWYRGAAVEIPGVLVDTGSASTVIDADLVDPVGIYAEPTDRLRTLRGVGGHEHVYVRRVDRFEVGGFGLSPFDVEIGEMDYGFSIHGILGIDFLRAARAVIDLGRLTLDFT